MPLPSPLHTTNTTSRLKLVLVFSTDKNTLAKFERLRTLLDTMPSNTTPLISEVLDILSEGHPPFLTRMNLFRTTERSVK